MVFEALHFPNLEIKISMKSCWDFKFLCCKKKKSNFTDNLIWHIFCHRFDISFVQIWWDTIYCKESIASQKWKSGSLYIYFHKIKGWKENLATESWNDLSHVEGSDNISLCSGRGKVLLFQDVGLTQCIRMLAYNTFGNWGGRTASKMQQIHLWKSQTKQNRHYFITCFQHDHR